jgi:hypothetical protein
LSAKEYSSSDAHTRELAILVASCVAVAGHLAVLAGYLWRHIVRRREYREFSPTTKLLVSRGRSQTEDLRAGCMPALVH